MKLATVRNGRPDGQLVVVSRDLSRYASAGRIAPHLQAALDDWDNAEPALAELAGRLDRGDIAAQPFDTASALAPLPRAYQWIDGAGYLSHLERVRSLAGSKDAELQAQRPLLYQGGSDKLVAAQAPIVVPDDGLGVDFEAEIAVVTGPVPMQADRAAAIAAIRLIGICNDVSLRRLVVDDLQNGFGFFHAKPATSFSPVFATPDEFGSAWTGTRLHARIAIDVNGKPFGRADAGTDMHFDFADLIVAATRTRELGAGTIVGSGTVTNRHDEVPPMKKDGIGFSCIVEARAVEKLRYGRARTPFLKAGDRIRIAAVDAEGREVLGAIDQIVEVFRS